VEQEQQAAKQEAAKQEAAKQEQQQAAKQVPVPSPPARVADAGPSEQEKQLMVQREQAQRAFRAYDQARSQAADAGAEKFSAELFQQARTLASRAQEKLNQANFTGALQDFEEATRQMERATSVSANLRADADKRSKESAQRSADLQAIWDLLRQYKEAMEGKNMGALRRVWPALSNESEKTIRGSFKFQKSMQLELEPRGEPRVSEGSAIVYCRQTQRVIFSDGLKRESKSDSTITLRKSNGTWLIESIENVVVSQ
jgi:hypothetical protein